MQHFHCRIVALLQIWPLLANSLCPSSPDHNSTQDFVSAHAKRSHGDPIREKMDDEIGHRPPWAGWGLAGVAGLARGLPPPPPPQKMPGAERDHCHLSGQITLLVVAGTATSGAVSSGGEGSVTAHARRIPNLGDGAHVHWPECRREQTATRCRASSSP